eukprot:TRINITY_DN266_c0_g1_i2.p1 TRINITY_DN266_c0_g1~~TRINITY_DN266_c0_g1_i2.p1  ORF type:complete len:335 (+),score=58.27 TRINITY_DN266_c0_g1_i2:35-1039(+)
MGWRGLHQTSLQHAVIKDNLSLVKMLLLAGANPNASRRKAEYPKQGEKQALRLAVDHYCKHPGTSIEIIDVLLKHKADPTVALKDAIKNNSLEMTNYLLEKGANVIADPKLTAALVDAAAAQIIEGADLTIIKLLFDAGATVGFNSVKFKLYYQGIAFNGCNYYFDYHPKDSALCQAIKKRSLDLLELLLRNGGREAINENIIGHRVFKARCPVGNEGSDIFKAIGATETRDGRLTFECQNDELGGALAYCMGTHDYYCDGYFYHKNDFDDYYYYNPIRCESCCCHYLMDEIEQYFSYDDVCVDKYGYTKGRVKGPKKSRTRTHPDVEGYDLYP